MKMYINVGIIEGDKVSPLSDFANKFGNGINIRQRKDYDEYYVDDHEINLTEQVSLIDLTELADDSRLKVNIRHDGIEVMDYD